jgi:hypothetical protein
MQHYKFDDTSKQRYQHYFEVKLCMKDEVFMIYIQLTKVGRLNTLSNKKNPH